MATDADRERWRRDKLERARQRRAVDRRFVLHEKKGKWRRRFVEQIALRARLLDRQDGEMQCRQCGVRHYRLRDYAADHVLASSKGGADHMGNRQLICLACNQMKAEGTNRTLKVKLDIMYQVELDHGNVYPDPRQGA